MAQEKCTKIYVRVLKFSEINNDHCVWVPLQEAMETFQTASKTSWWSWDGVAIEIAPVGCNPSRSITSWSTALPEAPVSTSMSDRTAGTSSASLPCSFRALRYAV